MKRAARVQEGEREREGRRKEEKKKKEMGEKEKEKKRRRKRERGEERKKEEREASARFATAVGHARELRRSAGKRCMRIEEEQRDGMVIGTGVRATNRRKRFEFGDEKILKNIFSE